ncbi:unnamed protein product [Allacma fusca]|uniref:Uncharacterized protein n=1 Tax=Allacma fusca TaxID=39272 RepID=A0A8J2NY06_9HEXA|nr:unnamed protein product [Allacma fusca]
MKIKLPYVITYRRLMFLHYATQQVIALIPLSVNLSLTMVFTSLLGHEMFTSVGKDIFPSSVLLLLIRHYQ